MTKEEILQILKAVKYPPYSRDIVSFGMVKYVKADECGAQVKIFTGGNFELAEKIAAQAKEILEKQFPGRTFEVEALKEDPSKSFPAKPAEAGQPAANELGGVKLKIAVASGKGGVGKSTVAVNLARAFARIFRPDADGAARVGLMDCDIHGPSATILFGEKVFPSVTEDEKIVPPEIGGIKVMSMGMLVGDEQPLLWRGPMVTSALKQFADQTLWGNLDVMVLDLPPGSGDAVLSVVQLMGLDGAVIVTTPNELAATTALRGAMAFSKGGVKILGVVENMAYFEMPDGTREYIFGEGAAEETAAKLGAPLLASIAIDKSLHTSTPSNSALLAFDSLADIVRARCAQ